MSARAEQLDDIGDENAPAGSSAWCKAMHVSLRVQKHSFESTVCNFGSALLGMRQQGWFGSLRDRKGKPFPDFEAYCRHDEPEGLGLSDRELAAIFDEAEQEKPLAAVLRSGPGRPKASEDNPCERKDIPYGTAEHWKARLRRDDPDMAARVGRGELSANAAALEKGWRKPQRQLAILRRAWAKASPEERRVFRAEQDAGS